MTMKLTDALENACVGGGSEILINMGPHHPSTHGVLRFILSADGEVIRRVVPVCGYLHRGIEKIAESTVYAGFVPYTDRIDYLGAMFGNHAYVMGIEQALGIEVPRRAEFLRIIASELNRIASHIIGVTCMGMDIGAVTPFVHGIRERELINDLTEMMCGARLTYNYMRVGGVSREVHPDFFRKLADFLEKFDPGFIGEFNRLLSGNEIYIRRCIDIATIDAAEAMDMGLVGPNLRGSGVDWDLRRDTPYSLYSELQFNVPIGRGFKGTLGDSYDRFVVRVQEMEESARIIRGAMAAIEEGPIQTKVPRKLKLPVGEWYSAVESARGEMGFYIVSDGGETPVRLKIRTGSFSGMPAIQRKAPGCMIADMVVLIGGMDLVAPEIDR
jgi:NADH-quinone oxidoreductase subunit D